MFSFATNLLLDQRRTRLDVLLWESGAELARRLDQTGHSEGGCMHDFPSLVEPVKDEAGQEQEENNDVKEAIRRIK